MASSMENKETKTESRGNRIRGCVAEGRAGAAGHADLYHRSGGGLRDSSGRPCIWGKRVSRGTALARGARNSGIRSHLWACKASSCSSSDNDSLSSSGMVSCGVWSHFSMLHSESPFMSVLADNRRTERTHSQSLACVRSILLPGMELVLLFLLSSGGIGLDSGENAAGMEHDVLG
jgi:hypothetical protein